MKKILNAVLLSIAFQQVYAISDITAPAVVPGANSPERAIIPMIFTTYVIKGEDDIRENPCGGILYNKKYIITALHCLNKSQYVPHSRMPYSFTVKDLNIVLPSSLDYAHNDLTFNNPDFVNMLPFSEMKTYFLPTVNSVNVFNQVEAIYIPPKVTNNSITYYPDLAIIELKKAIPTKYPVPVELNKNPTASGSQIRAYGWSGDENAANNGENGAPGILRYISVNDLNYSPTVEDGSAYPDYFINGLAYGGDSGGPLIRINNGKISLLGIASYSDSKSYINYTNITPLENWIDEVTSDSLIGKAKKTVGWNAKSGATVCKINIECNLP